jgi:Zn-finger protein
MKCEFCGKAAKSLTAKWYRYDNGQQVREMVCPNCVAVHTQSLAGQGVK